MKRSWIIVLMYAFATAALVAQAPSTSRAETTVAVKGKMLVASNGARLGAVYRVTDDGSAQIIIDGKIVTIPAATISMVKGELTTSLTKSEVLALP